MEVNHEDGRGETKTERPRAKKSDKSEDGGQIDCIIGSYGKYQLMIFLFKIIIGAASAVHNLGVTFYAPTGYVSFWCADSELVSSRSNNLTPVVGSEPNSTLAVIQQHFNESELHKLPYADHLQVLMPARDESWTRILRDFVYNEERGRRRASENFDSDIPENLRKECTFLSPEDNKLRKCSSFKYDTGIWMSTIIEEWNLVCDRSIFVSVTQSLYMTGSITAFTLFGYLSDRFGRYRSCVAGYAIEVLAGFGCVFSGNIAQFMIFRFLLGVGASGRSSTIYLIMIEWTGPKWRMHVSTLGSIGWAVGYCLLPWLAMYFLHFRHLMLFACFYELLLAVWLIFYVPESPRWLLTHQKIDEARRVLLEAAKFNGLIRANDAADGESVGSSDSNQAIEMLPTTSPEGQHEPAPASRRRLSSISLTRGQAHQLLAALPNRDQQQSDGQQVGGGPEDNQTEANDSLQPYSLQEFENRFQRLVEAISQKEFTQNENRLSYFDLLRWRNLRKYTLILSFAWACNSFIYYGIALRVGNLGGKNLFLSFTWAGFTELPSILFTLLFMKFLPRKVTNLLLFSIVFFLCTAQAPLKYYEIGWLRQSTMILAKLFNSCSFIVILYQTMELFPTSIRQTAYSSCALSGRIGSILAPFTRELTQHTNNLVAPILYAVLSMMEILLIRRLPETQGSDLPDTLLEAEKFKGTSKRDRK